MPENNSMLYIIWCFRCISFLYAGFEVSICLHVVCQSLWRHREKYLLYTLRGDIMRNCLMLVDCSSFGTKQYSTLCQHLGITSFFHTALKGFHNSFSSFGLFIRCATVNWYRTCSDLFTNFHTPSIVSFKILNYLMCIRTLDSFGFCLSIWRYERRRFVIWRPLFRFASPLVLPNNYLTSIYRFVL